MRRYASGVSLIELMVAVGVIGIITAIAVPMYTDYIDTARRGVMSDNIESIRLFEEDYKLAEGTYVSVTYDPDDPDAAGGMKQVLGWAPGTSNDEVTYVVVATGSTTFTVTATHGGGTVVSKTY